MTMEKVQRPWGHYLILANDLTPEKGLKYQIKKLVIKPEQQISLQSHDHRDEYWTILQGSGILIRGDFVNGLRREYLGVGGQLLISKKQVHRAINNQKLEDLVILEAQMGPHISEDDIVRYDDVYGRDIVEKRGL